MDRRLKGKAAVVTGTSGGGIGRAVAMRLAEQGAGVGVCARPSRPVPAARRPRSRAVRAPPVSEAAGPS